MSNAGALQGTTRTDLNLDGSRRGVGETTDRRRVLRRVGAVLAGLLAIFVVTTATDVVLHATGVFPPFGLPMADALFVFATAYRVVYGVAGGYLTARLAPDRPMPHALSLGALGLAFSIAGAVVMCDAGPVWYSLTIIAIAMPCAWAGGRLREAQLRARGHGSSASRRSQIRSSDR